MFNTLLYKCVIFAATSRYPLFHRHPLLLSLRFCTTTTSNSSSFAVSYLIHNLGFSPESASKSSKIYRFCFQTPEKPESVIRFFRDRGFSNSQIHNIVRKLPWLLSCDPCIRVFPKFEFLLSKGVSSSKIVDLVSKCPRILTPSLKNHIVPIYELIYRFLQSDKNTIACIFGNSLFTGGRFVTHNIWVMLENGVSDSNIAILLRKRSRTVFNSTGMLEVVEELKDLGFDPSKAGFAIALLAKKGIGQTSWKEKVNVFKKWGWSDEAFLEAFRREPQCMLTSIDKINIVMNFWVNQMGWDALDLCQCPRIFGSSMKKTIIPRAPVVQYLLAKGLRKKSASLFTPFIASEKVFIKKFVICFEEDAHQLLKLYKEAMSVQGKKEDGAASCSYQMVNS